MNKDIARKWFKHAKHDLTMPEKIFKKNYDMESENEKKPWVEKFEKKALENRVEIEI